MLRIGVTGGIGSGKSFVCKRLEAMGFPIFYSDAVSKKLMNEDESIKKMLIEILGNECYTEEGLLNRSFVAQKLFQDQDIKKRIEAIVHPRVAQAFAEWAEDQNSPFVFVESAILYESGFDQFVDKVIMVDAYLEIRINRTMQRDICSKAQAIERIQAQMDSQVMRKKANYILENNPNNDINAQLFKLMKTLYSTIETA